MKKHFLIFFVLGVLLGYATSVIADGYLTGWTVEKDGDVICYDPYVWSSIKLIECN